MKLIDSLLDAIVRLEGDALVMHVGEKPYVVTTSASMSAYRGPLAWGQVELSSRVLTTDAVLSMLAQILPQDQRQALDDFGAVEHAIAAPAGITDRFTVVAARGGDDIWLEVRRQPTAVEQPQPIVEQVEQKVAEQAPVSEAAAAASGAGSLPFGVAVQETRLEARDAAAGSAGVSGDERPEGRIEERVPVIDEVGPERPERVEHVVIPVDDDREKSVRDRGTSTGEAIEEPERVDEHEPEPAATGKHEVPEHAEVPGDAIQVIEEEPQHLPTEEDVDALLAATAAALLSDVPEVITFDTRVEEADMAPEPPPDWFVAVSQADAEAAHSESIEEPASEAVLDLDSTAELPFAAAAEEQMTGESVASGVVLEETVIEETIVRDTILEDGVFEESVFEQTIVEATMVENTSGVGAAGDWIEPIGPIDAAAFAEAFAAEHAGPGVSPVSPAPTSEAAAPDGVSNDTRPGAAASAGTDTATIGERRQSVSESMPESPRDYVGAGSRPAAPASSHYQAPEPSRPAVVVPLGRARVAVAGGAEPTHPAIQRTLRIAAERGASAVHLSTQARPMLRVSGEFTVLEDEPVLAGADIERLVNDLAPPDRQAGGLSEWMSDLPDVGRVRCVPFRDHRGPGVILRMVPLRSISADQLGLSPEIRDLCAQTDGLVLVAGSRASGKSTLLNGLVDLINRSRSDYVITIESQIGFVHEPRRSVVSQREIGGETANATSVVRSALLEDPDVLVLDDLQSPEVVALALEAVESGRLVFASVPASSSVAAVERLIELFPVAQRSTVQASLATALRAVIAQVLLRKASGGRTVAREVLLNTPAVSAIIQSGRTADLAAALDAGRGQGMLPLTESLAGLVREGTVHVAEAYRKALDRAALLMQLRRDGFDTSFAERLA